VDHDGGDLEQRMPRRVEAPGLDIDDDGQEAAKALGDIGRRGRGVEHV